MDSKKFKKELLKDNKLRDAFDTLNKDKNYILSRKLKELRIKNGLTITQFRKLIS